MINEIENEGLKDVFPKTYNRLENDVLVALLKTFSSITMTLEGDVFGKIYEYFLGKFAMAEGQRGGEFFTPTSLVKLIVEVIEPYHGRIYDPACGSGGMFVQSAKFVVMANSASDARQSELEVRKKLVEDRAVSVVIAIGPNFFYTVTLPCTLWFFDKGKKHTNRKDKVLFIDARSIYRQIDRAHREFTPEQIEFISNIVRIYREEYIGDFRFSSDDLRLSGKQIENLRSAFGNKEYRDIPGLCKVATIEEIIDQGYSLNPGRYVGVAEKEEEDFDFSERLHEQNEELERLNAEAHELEVRIAENVVNILEGRPNE